jgi:hypothetical protein
MWIALAISAVAVILVFSFGANRKSSWHTKENENLKDDPGSDDGA